MRANGIAITLVVVQVLARVVLGPTDPVDPVRMAGRSRPTLLTNLVAGQAISPY